MAGTSNINGLISGLDTDDIISKLIQIKQRPINVLAEKKTGLESKLTAWQDVNARLLAVKISSNELKNTSTFASKKVSVSDTTVLTASASSSASTGTYSLKVLSTAKSHQLGSALNYATSTDTGLGSGTITIKNVKSGEETIVTIKEGEDSLEAVKNAINIAGGDASASIISDGSSDPYRLLLTSKSTGADGELQITTNLTGGAGLSFGGLNSEITPPDDAQVQIGSGATPITVTSSSNSISTIIPGVTLNLLSDSEGKTISVTVKGDTESLVSKIRQFVNNFNNYIDFTKAAASFDSESQSGGVLLGDYDLRNVESEMSSLFNRSIGSLNGKYANLTSIGIRLGNDGKLALDEATLRQAIDEDSSAVSSLFARSGTASDSSITFLNATDKTKESTGSGYIVDIEQLATQTRLITGWSMTGNLAQAETVSINGTEVELESGMSLADVVQRINSKTSSSGVSVSATGADGTGSGSYLTFKAVQYGSAVGLSVFSSVSGAKPNSSGIGTTTMSATAPGGESGNGTVVKGLDVKGTINGEAATGSGQILTGDSTNTNTGGLAIMVTSATIGNKGYITYSEGVSAGMDDLLASLTDLTTGLVNSVQTGLRDQIKDVEEQTTSLIERLSIEETRIRTQYSTMESTLGKLQSTSAYLTAQISALTNLNNK